jgi:hypothetical protein
MGDQVAAQGWDSWDIFFDDTAAMVNRSAPAISRLTRDTDSCANDASNVIVMP